MKTFWYILVGAAILGLCVWVNIFLVQQCGWKILLLGRFALAAYWLGMCYGPVAVSKIFLGW